MGKEISVEGFPEAEDDGTIIQEFEPQKDNFSTFTSFSKKKFVSKVDGKLRAKWSISFAGACAAQFFNTIPLGAVIKVEDDGNCPDGDEVVKCIHN